MPEKIGVEAVIYKEFAGQKFFLLMHRSLNWKGWEFVKGGVDEGEKPNDAVKREITEETSLKNFVIQEKLPGKKEWTAREMKYIYDVFVVKTGENERVQIPETAEVKEHDDFKWCNKRDVMQLLTFDNSKKTFLAALNYLREKL